MRPQSTGSVQHKWGATFSHVLARSRTFSHVPAHSRTFSHVLPRSRTFTGHFARVASRTFTGHFARVAGTAFTGHFARVAGTAWHGAHAATIGHNTFAHSNAARRGGRRAWTLPPILYDSADCSIHCTKQGWFESTSFSVLLFFCDLP